MSTLLHPVGPRPARVYWVRRAVVLLAAAVLGTLVGVGIWALSGRGADDAPEGTTGAPADGTTSDGATDQSADGAADGEGGADGEAGAGATEPVACDPAALTVALTADGRSYPEGTSPTFSLSVTNAGAVSCLIDANETNREVLVSSGSDRIWSSLDCPVAPAESLQLIEAGGRYDASIAWPRVRSAQGCPTDLPAPRAGTYTAVATVLGVPSATVVLDLG